MTRAQSQWRPGRDRRAVRHPAPAPRASASPGQARSAVVVGGGIAGLAAAVGLAERGVRVTLVERQAQLGGRVGAWPTTLADGSAVTMSRGFHAFFRQYYNLRGLLRRVDPDLSRLTPLEDYPLVLAGGHRDSFASIPRTPPLNLLAFVARSPSFRVRDLLNVDVAAALGLLDVAFPATFGEYDGVSAAQVLDRLRFPPGARHLALEVFARSFFADPTVFSGGELVAMFHTYFLGSAEGLLFDVAGDDFDRALWGPLGRHLAGLGVDVRTGAEVTALAQDGPGKVVATVGQESVTADAAVLATDVRPLRRLVGEAGWLGTPAWRDQVAALESAPPFAVHRLWLDRPAAPGSPPFLGTSNFGPLDNVSLLEQLEEGARAWSQAHGGAAVVELHAYAVPPGVDETALRAQLWEQLLLIHPELAGAAVLGEQWLMRSDCPLVSTRAWADRPGVGTPDERVVLAGDGIRCDWPVALMERAATTGFLAANQLLAGWGLAGHDLWTVPLAGRHALAGPLRRAAGHLPGSRRAG